MSTVDLFQAKVTSKNAKIRCQWTQEVKIHGIPGDLRQAFSNLLVNGLDVIETGSERVCLECSFEMLIDSPLMFEHQRTLLVLRNDLSGPSALLRGQVVRAFSGTGRSNRHRKCQASIKRFGS